MWRFVLRRLSEREKSEIWDRFEAGESQPHQVLFCLLFRRKPTDTRWVNVCDDYGVRLLWPEVLGRSGPTISS